eukprot:6348406-Pyramimonas_sp.AAC.1
MRETLLAVRWHAGWYCKEFLIHQWDMRPSDVSEVLSKYGPDACPKEGNKPLPALPGTPASTAEGAARPSPEETQLSLIHISEPTRPEPI